MGKKLNNKAALSPSRLIKSFSYAFNGLFYLIKKERNFQVHIIATIVVFFAGLYFKITIWEWIVISICCTLVLALEALNTAIENLCNLINPQKNNTIKIIKDVSASAVLIASIGAIIIAAFIFYPKISVLLN